ncbi:hypothetical protein GH714_030186 [Hevea brasiliensis]|uniref:Uncharacterized protein n=1 Tax=Hevea brasiliensis TaxID=3981 RepID=A0A6A6MQ79_HEVBR|nr:hypothetical protein GH714_030186 [Hevea brasiliensis]
MKSKFRVKRRRRGFTRQNLGKIMNCLCSGEQSRPVDEMVPSSESLATKDYSLGGYSSKNGEAGRKPDTSNIEEAELTLRERGSLNYEEARALLGRIEYQKGNIEAALHVFEGIDIGSVTPKMKITLASKGEHRRRHSQNFATSPMSVHAVSLLLEAVFLKAKSLQHLGRFNEAAQSCKVILDIVESSLPEGLPENFAADCKLQETLIKAVELLPELWKLADCPREAILSYRRALLHHWNLDAETTARIQKYFVIFLLYSGGEACPPNLRSQMDMSGDLKALANQVEELPPGIIDRREMFYMLALCYHGAGEDLASLNLLRKLLHSREDPKCIPALLLASKSDGNPTRSLELEVWHDLASVYISLSQWHDAEICLSKSKAISYYSASRCHTTDVLMRIKSPSISKSQMWLSKDDDSLRRWKEKLLGCVEGDLNVDQSKGMLGTFAPQREPYVHTLEEETTPSGALARGIYSAKLKVHPAIHT